MTLTLHKHGCVTTSPPQWNHKISATQENRSKMSKIRKEVALNIATYQSPTKQMNKKTLSKKKQMNKKKQHIYQLEDLCSKSLYNLAFIDAAI